MIDIGLSKMALIGAVALIVIGPEKLPRVARTVGTLLGKAQRYVADVKAEVNRSMELDELRKVKDSMETAMRDAGQTMQTTVSEFEKNWHDAKTELDSLGMDGVQETSQPPWNGENASTVTPAYRHPNKNFRRQRSAVPRWYKTRTRLRTHIQSGAARVARFRPKR